MKIAKLAITASLATFLCLPVAEAKPDLGRKWTTSENGWTGTWTRISNSNHFNGTFRHPRHGSIRTKLIIHQGVGNKITIKRRDVTGPGKGKTCTYRGKITGNGKTASGTFGCQWARGPFRFSARISGQRYFEFRYPMYPGSRTHRLDYRWSVPPAAKKAPGRDPAHAFCRAKGYRTAVHWDKDSRATRYRTRFIGSRRNCKKRCYGYSKIHCR